MASPDTSPGNVPRVEEGEDGKEEAVEEGTVDDVKVNISFYRP